MNEKTLNDALKGIKPEKIEKAKNTLLNTADISELLSKIDVKKAGEMLNGLNIGKDMLGGILKELKNNPNALNEIKNKLK